MIIRDNNLIIAAGLHTSPAFDAYKARVEADGGTVERDYNKMARYYGVMQRSTWCHIVSGRKAGKLYSIFPNNAAYDLNVTRASKNIEYGKAGQMIEVANNVPAFDWDASKNLRFQGLNVANQTQNRVPTSNGTTYPVFTGVTLESPYTWAFSPLLTHAVYYGDNSTTRRANKQIYTLGWASVFISAFVEMLDGSEPMEGDTDDVHADFAAYIGGGWAGLRPGYIVYKKQITSTVWYITVTAQVGESTNNHFQKTGGTTRNSNKPFRLTGYNMQRDELAPGRPVITTGTSVAKLFDDVSASISLPMNNCTLFADMTNNYAFGTGTSPRGFYLRIDASNFIVVGFTPAGFISMAIVSGGNVILQINSNKTSGKVCARFVNEQYALVVNGVTYTAFAVGNQFTANPFTTSATVQLGSSERNINLRCVAVLPNITTTEMIKHSL